MHKREKKVNTGVMAELLTVGELATRLEVKKTSVHNWIARHDNFPPAKATSTLGAKLYSWDEVKAWREARKTHAYGARTKMVVQGGVYVVNVTIPDDAEYVLMINGQRKSCSDNDRAQQAQEQAQLSN